MGDQQHRAVGHLTPSDLMGCWAISCALPRATPIRGVPECLTAKLAVNSTPVAAEMPRRGAPAFGAVYNGRKGACVAAICCIPLPANRLPCPLAPMLRVSRHEHAATAVHRLAAPLPDASQQIDQPTYSQWPPPPNEIGYYAE